MRYRYLLCDNDNTLMDFDAAERGALEQAARIMALPFDEDVLRLYHTINRAQWAAYERGETTQDRLRVERFRLLLGALELDEAQAHALADAFGEALATRADLMPGAMAFMEAVHAHMKVALVTNGLGATQRGRLRRCPFTPYLDAVIISGETGVSKPDPRMAYLALEALGCADPREAVLLGDSESSDIACACAAGIDSIHLAMRSAPSARATRVAFSLEEAREMLLKE